ncbi:BTB/POZ domain-containing protein At5g67385-like [Olea europaea var. sylvestris]|uniref:BTB POZ domain-containing At5g67385 n=1 Tax=Olea europaea subsp. europaea TaxID=158383 RepID=A0A8S0UAF4_OLEEU|nr:BTB/POZ domain-containing protein At5g67385-like [Olea europaea var. sylvestris]CAA3014496.1 BTB POZ domain-containing At5g67385 [Olea europaea subsp. europaea]
MVHEIIETADLDQEQSAQPMATKMFAKKNDLLSTAMKRTSEWIFSQEIPSDVTVSAGGTSFSLHKFPLVSKCGYVRKLVSGSSDTDLAVIKIPDIPGGAEAFELAAKFCYGINFELSTENIAMLRCVAEYLEMTEDYAVENLVERTEKYLNEVALKSLAGAVTILHSSENLLPLAEKVKLVSRCIDMIAFVACRDGQFSSPGRVESDKNNSISSKSSMSSTKPVVDWWAEDLTVLRINFFQRVLVAMMARGFKQYALGPILMLYAQKSLRGLEIFGKGRKKIEAREEHEKRVVLETIVSLLPREKNAMSVSFLSMLLRAAIHLETTVACRLDLEKRMALQLAQAVLDDLLIPSYSFTGDTLFDVETVQRIMMNYMEYEMEGNRSGYNADKEYISPSQSDMECVSRLMESYLAEIASDRNLSVSKFISLAELIPEQSRITEDGMYRSIDIYLKAHPALSDMERKKVCSVMDCQKLSREACAHAAQNDRLPVQTVVQVLYYEQQRLREVMDSSLNDSPSLPTKPNRFSIDIHPVPDELSTLRKENQDLKLELVKMKMRLKEIAKSDDPKASFGSPSGNRLSFDKPPLPRKSFISSVSKTLGRFIRADGIIPQSTKRQNKPSKDRRHSIS